MSFSFGAPKTATGFTLPTSTAPTTSTIGSLFSAGAGDTSKAGTPSLFATSVPSSTTLLGGAAKTTTTLTFGTPSTAATATPASGLGFGGATTTTASTGLTFGAQATSTPSLQFGVSSTGGAAPKTTTLSFTPIPTTSTTTSTSAPALSSAAPTLTFKSGTTSSATTTSAAATLSLTSSTSAATAASSTSVATTTASVPASGTITFSQLEDLINKWTIDLEEQSKIYLNQAKQLNAWDLLLISNGEKVLNLNNGIERVKQQQQQLDQELDFVLAQQKELEELIIPLEKELSDIPITDQDRNHTYQLAEELDSQLKQMCEDLKDIIENLNESNKSDEMADPVTQISRIMNAHMNSLQWIDRHTAQISSQLEQISKLQDLNRRNNAY